MYKLKSNERKIETIKNQLTVDGRFIDYDIVSLINIKYDGANGGGVGTPVLHQLIESEGNETIGNSFALAEVQFPKSVTDQWAGSDDVVYNYILSQYEFIKVLTT